MKILSIDSSGLVATVAVLEDDELIAEYTVNYKKTHSETLLPMLDEIKSMIDLDMSTVEAIAVAKGPGSFTGLRIGSATVKGLAYALNIPVVAVPTVDAMSMNLWGSDKLICPIMDARRNQVYTGLYEFEDGNYKVVMEQDALAVEDLCEKLNEIGREVILLGDGVPVYRGQIDSLLKVKHSYAPANLNRQKASSLGVLAYKYIKEGKLETAEEHKPEYLRLSQAEREKLEKDGKA
ncbi:MAG: tRNA (adenosine(37)-N6)-threonylcarbamoyltransferase complex dimerization subunit type 1 TsaB [Lachnospiraceae bacterium]|nr:tRNA (adenosine(37)-N6)-threonylcarbamoyltransferase complex dimerization subunit type 1 TsaB [Lachnospiraceae bacterium]